MDKRLFRLRNYMNRKRPKFRRQESWRYKRLKPNWRRPKGIDNKMREHKKGYPPVVRVGYGGPKKVRGLHPKGKKQVLVYNVNDLMKINPEEEIATIGHGVGMKKREAICSKAIELGIHVTNMIEKYKARYVPIREEELEEFEEISEEEYVELDEE